MHNDLAYGQVKLDLAYGQVKRVVGGATPRPRVCWFAFAERKHDEHFTTNILRRTFFEKVSELVSWARQNKPFLLGLFILRSRSKSHEIEAN